MRGPARPVRALRLGRVEERRRQADRSEATRAKLVSVAREMFAKRGYGAVGTEEIVRRAKVTRGALYHHFEDKRDLFRAVHEQVERELAERIGASLDPDRPPLALLEDGMRTFLDACEQDPAVRQIALLDAPAVLGWREWREVDAKYGMGLVVFSLRNAMDAGALERQPVEPLAHIMLGALGEAALMIADADDAAATRREVEGPLLGLLNGLRA
jgi:AcrR family transcriptional regulator